MWSERREQQRTSLTDVMEMAAAFFQEQLHLLPRAPKQELIYVIVACAVNTAGLQVEFFAGLLPAMLKSHLAARRDQRTDRSLWAGASWRRYRRLL